MDYILKNGKVVDTVNGEITTGDVYICEGKIANIGKLVGATNHIKTIDCTDKLIVPGLIDMHTHTYPIYPRFKDSLPAFDGEAFALRSGVTTIVDAGTTGIEHFESFYDSVIKDSKLNFFAYLNIANGGMVHLNSEQIPNELNPSLVCEMANKYKNTIVGIKSAHYWVGLPFDDVHTPWLSVDKAIEAAESAHLPLMVDFQPNGDERTYEKLLLNHLRPGDIHTHVYAQQFRYFDDKGDLLSYMWKAKEKGILFDLGHGRRSFWFRNCIPAIKQGFLPDTISTDIYSANVCSPVVDLMNVMSKMIACGMNLIDVIRATTIKPAMIIKKPELGVLKIGANADIAVLSVHQGDYGFEDGGRTRLTGKTRLQADLSIKNGEILWDREVVALTSWENAPKSYWEAPGVVEY